MIKKILPKTEYGKNILITISGSSIAQIFPIIISPFLTRLYSPEDFGFLSIYLLGISLLTIISTGKFENAFFISKSNNEVHDLYGISLILSIVFSTILLIFVIFFGKDIWINYEIKSSVIWVYILPISVLLSSVYILLTQLSIRLSSYQRLSKTRIIFSGSNSSVSLFLGMIAVNSGLLISNLVSSILAVLFLKREAQYNFFRTKKKKNKFIALLKKYKKIPLFMIPSGVINHLSANMPTVILTSIFGLSSVGFYSLVQRVLAVPSGFIGNSFGEVFRQQAAEDLRESGSCRKILVSTVLKLGIIFLVPFLLLGIFSPLIFSIVFGKEWIGAGEMAQYLVPMFYIRFITMPVASVILLRNKTEIDFIWQICFLLLSCGAVLFSDIDRMMIYFSISFSIAYLASFIINYKLAKIND